MSILDLVYFLNMKVQLQAIMFPTNNCLLNKQGLNWIYCFLLMAISIHHSFGQEQQKDEDVINLQKAIITETTEIPLDSGWSFYWNQLIAPGHFKTEIPHKVVTLNNWTAFNTSHTKKPASFGYATYRLRISIPKERPHVSLYIPKTYSASKIWINGTFISEIGHIGVTKAETLHRRFSQIIPLNTNETDFEIVIQIANFYHSKGGLIGPVLLGSSQHLYNTKSKRIAADTIFIGCLGFIGVFFLVFFLLYWNKDKAVLYFAVLCISLSYMALSDRYAPLADLFQSANWILLTKIEYLFLFLSGISASFFFQSIFYDFIHKAYSKIINYSFYLLAFLAVFLPAPYFTKLLLPFLVLMLLNLLYMTFILIKAIFGKRHDSILLLVSMVLGLIIFYIHIFFFLEGNSNAIVYVNFGYIVVFLILSTLLMTRFSNSFKELEQSKKLALQQQKELFSKTNQLSNANLVLGENLRVLKNYNAELDNFNHIVSHDLKSPLIAVHSLVSFIEEDLKTTLNEDTKQHLKLVKNRVSKMSSLIDGLLKYSKIAKGKKDKELFSLNELLNDVIRGLNLLHKNTINLPNEDVEVFANKIELFHVFQNLISNAIKYNDKDTIIISIVVSKLPNEYLFSVSDNGPGIEEKYHTKIFEIFSKLDVDDDTQSSGIGLAIVNKIVTENKGAISVASEKNVGLKISFSWQF
jgi:signal transduction histidine kinase